MQPKHLVYLISTALILTFISIVVVLLASGYRFNPETGTIEGTGIISVTSTPDGGLVYINSVPKDATNTSVTNLKPGNYNVRVEKQGFAVWEKDVAVEAELVSKAEILLIPLFPSLNPLTFTGVINPVTSPDHQKILYALQDGTSAGIWLLDLEERPFNLNRDPLMLLRDTPENQYSQGTWQWSADGNSLLITLPAKGEKLESYVLFDLTSGNNSIIVNEQNLLNEWTALERLQQEELLVGLNTNVVEEIKSLDIVSWSPDLKSILHRTESDGNIDYKVYYVPPVTTIEVSPTPNPTLAAKQNLVVATISKDTPHALEWFPDSSHLTITKSVGDSVAAIEVIENTGTNKTQLFTGPVKNLFTIPNPSGSKVIVLTNFNPSSLTYNLYAINLR